VFSSIYSKTSAVIINRVLFLGFVSSVCSFRTDTIKKGFCPMMQVHHGTKACYFCGTTQIDVKERPLESVPAHALP
jgi:hypothetical protein